MKNKRLVSELQLVICSLLSALAIRCQISGRGLRVMAEGSGECSVIVFMF